MTKNGESPAKQNGLPLAGQKKKTISPVERTWLSQVVRVLCGPTSFFKAFASSSPPRDRVFRHFLLWAVPLLPLAQFLRMYLVGEKLETWQTFRWPIGLGLLYVVLMSAIIIFGLLISSAILQMLVKKNNGNLGKDLAFASVAYSLTPLYLFGSLMALVYSEWVFFLLCIVWSAYLHWKALKVAECVPPEKQLSFVRQGTLAYATCGLAILIAGRLVQPSPPAFEDGVTVLPGGIVVDVGILEDDRQSAPNNSSRNSTRNQQLPKRSGAAPKNLEK